MRIRLCSRSSTLAVFTALAAPCLAGPALAQSTEESTVGSDTDVIIVTAQRRAEALEDVPMSVSVVTAETLAATGVSSIRDIANVTTGFQVANSGSYPQPAIRGITTINAGSYENNVALYVDGLYQVTPQVLNMDLPNVQSVQILKGPQGTLYGRNATGGAILLDTIDPGETWEGQFEATYGRFDDRRLRAYVAGPINEAVSLSLAGTLRKTDGYYKRASRTTPGDFDGRFLGLDQNSFRAKMKVDVTEDFRATLAYNYMSASDPRGVIFTPTENVPNSYAPGTGRETRPRELGEVAGDVFDLDLESHEASLRLELDTGIGSLRSVTGFTKSYLETTFDFAGSYVPDLYATSGLRDRTWQQALDFTINAIDNVDLIFGGTYYNIKTDFPLPNSTFLGPASLGPYANPATTEFPLSDYRKSSETFFFRTKNAWAVFADVTFHATDRLSINLGGRYSKETQDVSGYKINYSLATGAPSSCPYSRNDEVIAGLTCTRPSARNSSYTKFTPRASIRYEITPGTNVYASYSKGFRSGEWNSVIPNDNPNNWFDVKQESVTAYEVGLKSAGNRLRFEAAAFYYDYTNLQVSFTQNVGGTALVILQNAPSAEIYGAETSVDYEVIDNLNVRAGATWLHARYGDNFLFSGSGVNPAAGFNTNDDPLKTLINTGQASGPFAGRTVTQDLSGMQMSRAPNFSAFVGFDYLIPDGDGGIRIAANAKYTDSYVVTNPSIWGGDPTYSPLVPGDTVDNFEQLRGTPYESRSEQQRARQGKYVLINASVTWTDPTDHYYVRVWGNNLGDVKYRTHYNPLASGTYSPIAEPRTYGLTAGYKF